MLHAHIDTLTLFRETLSDQDRLRLDEALTDFGKELLQTELLKCEEVRLKQLLATGRIPPILFQWALAVRDSYPKVI